MILESRTYMDFYDSELSCFDILVQGRKTRRYVLERFVGASSYCTEDMLNRLKPNRAQREQVEQIMADEVVRLQVTGGIPIFQLRCC